MGAHLASRCRRRHLGGMPKRRAEPIDEPAVLDACCPLCGRVLGTVNIDRHHLIPRTFKGKEQFPIHKICHRKIHSALTERELLQTYHSWEALRGHEDIRSFIDWVAKKPPGFYTRTHTSNKKKSR
jgi:5-methylcytosine-specific restriction endonuclease McrA